MDLSSPPDAFETPLAQLDLAAQLAWLEQAQPAELTVRWSEVFGGPPPAGLRSGMIRRAIAYRLQAERHGDLPRKLQVEMKRLAGDPSAKPAPALEPGTRLVRVWRGKLYEVAVLPNGFGWEGATYPSLTRLAFAITGTHWNGPRFFGLREERNDG